jgi:hypothetical protein
LHIWSAQYIFKDALKKSGIRKTASIHSLRHSFATHLLESGYDIVRIRDLLGHSSVRTTERYLQVAITKTLNVISPLDTLDQKMDVAVDFARKTGNFKTKTTVGSDYPNNPPNNPLDQIRDIKYIQNRRGRRQSRGVGNKGLRSAPTAR